MRLWVWYKYGGKSFWKEIFTHEADMHWVRRQWKNHGYCTCMERAQ